jgi:hypothetical protein
VLATVRSRYEGFGPTLAHEKLTELHGLRLSVETLRHWMIEDGLWIPRACREPRIQQPRRRRPCRGELIQIDGSDHEWFEERAGRCTLLVFVDDATSALMELRFCESESAFSYFTAMRSDLEQHGKPVALYSDKATIFRVNKKELQGGTGVTQFGRALDSLNIDILCANTPAAKGRVERAHLTLQDRLVKDLRLRGISDLEASFAPEFIADYKRVLYVLDPTDAAGAARGRRVGKDGSLSFWHAEYQLLAVAFSREHCVQQGDVVESKRLSETMEFIKERQRQRIGHLYFGPTQRPLDSLSAGASVGQALDRPEAEGADARLPASRGVPKIPPRTRPRSARAWPPRSAGEPARASARGHAPPLQRGGSVSPRCRRPAAAR